MAFKSKYKGIEIERILDRVANSDINGDISAETDPVFVASPAANITDENISSWNNNIEIVSNISVDVSEIKEEIKNKQDVISDLDSIREGAAKGATAIQEHQQLKTINGESIVGSGDITIQGGSGNSDANVQAVDTDEGDIDDAETAPYVKYVPQTLTEEQKSQARANLGIDDLISSVITNVLNTPV